jgi:hypothetical protein
MFWRHVVKYPVAELPSRHGRVKRAILQLIDQIEQCLGLVLVATSDRAVSIEFPVELFEKIAAAFQCKRLISTWERHSQHPCI